MLIQRPLAALLTALLSVCTPALRAQKAESSSFEPKIPRTWDAAAIASLELPLPDAKYSPRHVSEEYYYSIPVRPIYRSYPVYHPDHEPEGYWEKLQTRGPETVFDPARLKTRDDWVRSGELVFDAPAIYSSGRELAAVRNPRWYEAARIPVTKDGTLPFARYFVRKTGKVEIGLDACSVCHTRSMPDGSALKGGPGNFPLGWSLAFELRSEAAASADPDSFTRRLRNHTHSVARARWVEPDPNARIADMTLGEIIAAYSAMPPGVMDRNRTSLLFPVRVADLIGVRERRYLDASGLVQQRSIADLMRYVALNQGGDSLSSFGGFLSDGRTPDARPDPSTLERYSDAALYALALFLSSLTPPPNPNRFDDSAQRGRSIFRRERCSKCHPAPLYTNNKLLPVAGFTPPKDHRRKFRIFRKNLRTDPHLTLHTRRGTGYYKVPSLKGVWYRGPFGHDGAVATLEDWFDPRRLRDDYRPTGYRGAFGQRGAVSGHTYGLDLTRDERRDLIAFLKTL